MNIENLRRMCRQGDVEALDELVRTITRRNLWPSITPGLTEAIENVIYLNFTHQFSFAHTVELIHQLLVGVPLCLTSMFFGLDLWEEDEFAHPSEISENKQLRWRVEQHCKTRGFPAPVNAPGGSVSYFTKQKKRGVVICLPTRLSNHITFTATSVNNTLSKEDSKRRRCPSFLTCSLSEVPKWGRWGQLEFLPERGCEKTPLASDANMACGKRATTERAGCWEWDGRVWRQV